MNDDKEEYPERLTIENTIDTDSYDGASEPLREFEIEEY